MKVIWFVECRCKDVGRYAIYGRLFGRNYLGILPLNLQDYKLVLEIATVSNYAFPRQQR